MTNPRPATRWECPPRQVLVPVDFGDASARAMGIARFIATAFTAHLRALHAERFEPPPYFTIEQITRLEAERKIAQAAAADHLARFAAASAYQVESIVVDEPPVEAILQAAGAVDLVVLGTHGRRGPGRWWLGSVAERVVRGASVPVLVTHAARTPPSEVFGHVTLVRSDPDGDEAALRCAACLAGLGSGPVVEAAPVPQCGSDALHDASLVVLASPRERTWWGLSDAVTSVLAACDRPILFIPEH